HQPAPHTLPPRRRRGRGLRLHAGGGRRAGAQPRAARENGARRAALPDALRPALRLRPRAAHGGAAERHRGVVRRACGRRGARAGLRSSVPMRLDQGAATAEFTLGADESAWFVLEVVRPQQPSLSAQPDYESDAFKQTVNFWRRWVARSTYDGRWREMVNRSALTLKLLTSRPHGSIVAAPTFGLPETVGGERNWDYRYTWIRDSSFTLYGLMRLGYTQEAAAFMRWVMARIQELKPDGSLQITYGLDGRHELREETLPPSRGVHGLAPGPHRECRARAPPARHLRRAPRLGVSLRQVRLTDLARRLDGRHSPGRLGGGALAGEGREYLGGPRRSPGVPLLARHVLGGDRPRHPPGEQALVSGSALALVRRAGHHLSRHLRPLLGRIAPRLRPASRREHARR